ncbi:MAG: sensor histidine kinase [Crocinitomicaceae bacterium]
MISSFMDIANLYYVQYKDDLAIPFFEKAYHLSKESSDFELKQNAALNMSVVEENRKNPTKSLAYRKEYEQWNDSINDQNRVWAIAQQEKKFVSERDKKEIEILAKDNALKKNQVNSFIYSSILLLLLFTTLLFFYLSKRKVNRIILSQKNELDVLNDTKDRLFSIVSHDLRSNVNAISKNHARLSSSFSSKQYEDVEQQIQQGDTLTNNTKSLLNNMLSWALLQTDQMYFEQENLNLQAIVGQVTHDYTGLLDSKRITLEVNIPEYILIFADSGSLKIVMRNILDNAIKFSNYADTIFIHAKVHTNKQCELTIEDTGSGMSKEALSELFNRTGDQSKKVTRERTGLGLHLCQSLIQTNSGSLKIESEQHIGTKLIISIPLSNNHE